MGIEQAGYGIARLEGTALKDGKEGWITTKGSAGTAYTKCDEGVYNVLQDVNITKMSNTDSPVVRKLEAGESLELLEGPKEDEPEEESRIKVRAASDKAVGWVTEKPVVV